MSGATKLRWFLVALFVAVAGFVVALLEGPMFEVQTVQISGAARTSEGAILEALDIADDQALLTYDAQEGSAAVADLAWVEAVSLTRQWPSTLRVVVRERTVSAAIARPSGSEWVVLAGDGVVVEYRMSPPSGVPLIVATNEIVEASTIGEPLAGVDRVLEISRDLPLQLDPWVTTWRASEDGEVTAELVGSARANFGRLDDHRTQFVSLASILNGGASLVCLEVIDLTIADTPVLHRDPNCLLQSAALG
ncbi:MAG: FtsQ-type POTRA domain-containing protein [Acidimicrobiia bacterium]|nr:FtsQ-type POTRA domain-containing protein [Acidimicrobiia bacterium]